MPVIFGRQTKKDADSTAQGSRFATKNIIIYNYILFHYCHKKYSFHLLNNPSYLEGEETSGKFVFQAIIVPFLVMTASMFLIQWTSMASTTRISQWIRSSAEVNINITFRNRRVRLVRLLDSTLESVKLGAVLHWLVLNRTCRSLILTSTGKYVTYWDDVIVIICCRLAVLSIAV